MEKYSSFKELKSRAEKRTNNPNSKKIETEVINFIELIRASVNTQSSTINKTSADNTNRK